MANLTPEQRRGMGPPRAVEDAAARKRKAQPAPARPVGGPHPLNTIGGQPVPSVTEREPGALDQVGRGLRIGMQGQGEMIGDMLGAPGAIARFGRDAVESYGRRLSNAALGEEGGAAFRDQLGKTPAGRVAASVGEQVAEALPTSDELKTGFTNDLRATGLDGAIIPEADMTPDERLAKEISRFGSGAALGSVGALRAAGSKLGGTLAGKLLLAREHRALRKNRVRRKFNLEASVGTTAGFDKGMKDLEREGLIEKPDREDMGPFEKALNNAADEFRAAREEEGTLAALDAWRRALGRLPWPGQ